MSCRDMVCMDNHPGRKHLHLHWGYANAEYSLSTGAHRKSFGAKSLYLFYGDRRGLGPMDFG